MAHRQADTTSPDCNGKSSTPLTLSATMPSHLQNMQSATFGSMLPAIFRVRLFDMFICICRILNMRWKTLETSPALRLHTIADFSPQE